MKTIRYLSFKKAVNEGNYTEILKPRKFAGLEVGKSYKGIKILEINRYYSGASVEYLLNGTNYHAGYAVVLEKIGMPAYKETNSEKIEFAKASKIQVRLNRKAQEQEAQIAFDARKIIVFDKKDTKKVLVEKMIAAKVEEADAKEWLSKFSKKDLLAKCKGHNVYTESGRIYCRKAADNNYYKNIVIEDAKKWLEQTYGITIDMVHCYNMFGKSKNMIEQGKKEGDELFDKYFNYPSSLELTEVFNEACKIYKKSFLFDIEEGGYEVMRKGKVFKVADKELAECLKEFVKRENSRK